MRKPQSKRCITKGGVGGPSSVLFEWRITRADLWCSSGASTIYRVNAQSVSRQV